MAKYHENLQYHEDKTEKHMLTEEELRFLLKLQKELNTQNHVGQADPRFWVIKGTEKEYGIETGYEDGSDLVFDTEVVATDMESAMIYIRDNVLDEINETDGIQRKIEMITGIFHPGIYISWKDDGFDDGETFESMEEIAEWLNRQGYDCRIANYKIIGKIYPNTMFLTQKAAEDHLRNNSYHYSEDAHTYAMTSWRNPETEMLWRILQQTDWKCLSQYLQSGLEYADQPTLMTGA